MSKRPPRSEKLDPAASEVDVLTEPDLILRVQSVVPLDNVRSIVSNPFAAVSKVDLAVLGRSSVLPKLTRDALASARGTKPNVDRLAPDVDRKTSGDPGWNDSAGVGRLEFPSCLRTTCLYPSTTGVGSQMLLDGVDAGVSSSSDMALGFDACHCSIGSRVSSSSGVRSGFNLSKSSRVLGILPFLSKWYPRLSLTIHLAGTLLPILQTGTPLLGLVPANKPSKVSGTDSDGVNDDSVLSASFEESRGASQNFNSSGRRCRLEVKVDMMR